MADKRISQLIERTDIANNDVLPIVASGATTTNKVTISTIQDWMQDNLDVGVTSVGITLGTSGTDVNVSGSPITTSGNITINIPDASASARGVVTTGSQTFGGVKTFANGLSLPAVGGSNQITRIVNIGTLHEGTASLNQIGFNSGNNIYFGKGLSNGGVISWNNSTVRYYTLPDADGTLALASQLDGYVTLGTAQTITGSKTFNSRIIGQDASLTGSGSPDTLEVTHTSGSGIAVDISKAGNGEGLRVTKTSGSGNAVTITGGNLEAPTIVRTGGTSTQYLMADGSVSTLTNPITGTGTTNQIPKFTASSTIGNSNLSDDGSAVTCSTELRVLGALNGTTASLTSTGTHLSLIRSTFNTFTIGTGTASGISGLLIGNNTAGTTPLIINQSTGAATFSSNVGLGVSPSPWDLAQTRTLELGTIGNYISGYVGSSVLYIGTNSYLDSGGWKYARTAASTQIDMGAGAIRFLQAASGTAGNALTWSNAMTIAASGNVGIGTDSPSDTLHVVRNGTGSYSAALWTNSSSTANLYVGVGGSGVANTPLRNNAYVMNAAASALVLGTSDTERMRITSGGDVEFNHSGGYITKVQANNQINAFYNSGGASMYLNYQGNGAIYAGSSLQVLYAGSDERIKTDINEFSSILQKVLNLKPKTFRYKERPDFETYGFIAQEVEQIMPELVKTSEGITMCLDEEIIDQKSVESYSLAWASILVKAIQELKAEIDSLKTK